MLSGCTLTISIRYMSIAMYLKLMIANCTFTTGNNNPNHRGNIVSIYNDVALTFTSYWIWLFWPTIKLNSSNLLAEHILLLVVKIYAV